MAFSSNSKLSAIVIRKISKEVADLVSNPPEGITIIPNETDITDIQAIIDGPAGTPYENGSFKVKLVLGSSFPEAPPKGIFLTKIFHPNISRDGEICVNTLKKDWNESLGIKHILLVVKCLLIHPNPESALNEEAGKMLLEEYDEYCKRAKMITDIYAKNGNENENINANELAKRDLLSASNNKIFSSLSSGSNMSLMGRRPGNYSALSFFGNNDTKKRTLKRF